MLRYFPMILAIAMMSSILLGAVWFTIAIDNRQEERNKDAYAV